jgi:hypothetical protein
MEFFDCPELDRDFNDEGRLLEIEESPSEIHVENQLIDLEFRDFENNLLLAGTCQGIKTFNEHGTISKICITGVSVPETERVRHLITDESKLCSWMKLGPVDPDNIRFEVIYNIDSKLCDVSVAKDILENYQYKLLYAGDGNWKTWIDAQTKKDARVLGISFIESCLQS